MRKIVVTFVVLVIAVCVCFAFLGCATDNVDNPATDNGTSPENNSGKDYDDAIKNLQDQLDELKNSLSDTQDALNSANTEIALLQSYAATGGRIYEIGETVTVAGMFSVTLTGYFDEYRVSITFTNLHTSQISVSDNFCTFTNSYGVDYDDDYGILQPGESRTVAGYITNYASYKPTYIFIGYPTDPGILPYAIFRL